MLQRYFVIEKGIYCLWLLTFPYIVSSVSRICPSKIKEHVPQEKRSWGGECFVWILSSSWCSCTNACMGSVWSDNYECLSLNIEKFWRLEWRYELKCDCPLEFYFWSINAVEELEKSCYVTNLRFWHEYTIPVIQCNCSRRLSLIRKTNLMEEYVNFF